MSTPPSPNQPAISKSLLKKTQTLTKVEKGSKYNEQFLRRRISYICLTRGAIARENALLSLVPLNHLNDMLMIN